MKKLITSIKRFAVHDGDGIRTTIFFKGCPLKCIWCHNPETISPQRQIALYMHKCTLCGACEKVCEYHKTEGGIHIFDREKCTFCGKCESVCPQNAIEIIGKEMSADEICEIVMKDKPYYETSGGGVTLSGGECLLWADFCAEVLKKLKKEGISTAVDTCGFVSKEAFDKVIPYTDTFLYDIKAADENVHIKCTGHSNKLILENLKYLDEEGKNIEIRVPCVPGFNDGEIEKIYELLKSFKNIVRVRILPYHNLAGSKYEALGMKNTLPEKTPSEEEIKGCIL